MKHYNITPKDWKYSSFNKFVQNGYYEQDWCNFEDKYNIKELDYELERFIAIVGFLPNLYFLHINIEKIFYFTFCIVNIIRTVY